MSAVARSDLSRPPPLLEIVSHFEAEIVSEVRNQIATLKSFGHGDDAVARALAYPAAYTAQGLGIVSSFHTIPDPPPLAPAAEAMIERFGPIPMALSTRVADSIIWRIPSKSAVQFIELAHHEAGQSAAALATIAGLPVQRNGPDSTLRRRGLMTRPISRYLELERPQTRALDVQQILHSVAPHPEVARIILVNLFWNEILDFVSERPSDETDLVLDVLQGKRNSTRLTWAPWNRIHAFLGDDSGAAEKRLLSAVIGEEAEDRRMETEALYRCVADRAQLLADFRGLPTCYLESVDLLDYLLTRAPIPILRTQDSFFPANVGYVDRVCLPELRQALNEIAKGKPNSEALRRIAGGDPADQEADWKDVTREYDDAGEEVEAVLKALETNEQLELAIGECAVSDYHRTFFRKGSANLRN